MECAWWTGRLFISFWWRYNRDNRIGRIPGKLPWAFSLISRLWWFTFHHNNMWATIKIIMIIVIAWPIFLKIVLNVCPIPLARKPDMGCILISQPYLFAHLPLLFIFWYFAILEYEVLKQECITYTSMQYFIYLAFFKWQRQYRFL